MAYIGNSPANIGNYQIVDDIASGFNGSLVSFALASGGIAITPAKSGQILANINGVMQEPDDGGTNGFKVTGSNIVFSSAPANGDTFWAVYQGQNVDIGTPSDDVVDTAHIKDDAVTADKLANSINTAIAANTAKTGITTSQASAITANTAKTGITSSQATAITAALPKAGGSMSGNLELNDNVKAAFGQSGDLEIFHDSTNSYIKDIGTGALVLQSNSSAIVLEKTDGENMLLCNTDGAVNIYHNGSEKIATSAAGATVTGALTATSFAGSGASLTGLTSAQMPAGSVIQVVYGTTSTRAATTSTSFVASNLSAAITPSSTSSKILIIFAGGGNNNNTNGTGLVYTLYRGSTNMGHSTAGMGYLRGGDARVEAGMGFTLLDDPTTTSATTYTLYFRSDSGSTVETAAQNLAKTGITLMEIAG